MQLRATITALALVLSACASCKGERAPRKPTSRAVEPVRATPPEALIGETTIVEPDRGPPPAPAAAPGLAAEIPTELVSEPVHAARAWTTALAPNRRGGWNFITQTYEYGSGAPTEFVVVDLETGKYRTFEGPPAVYSKHLYKIKNQLRASNGRIFFPMIDNRMAYYDPADETVKQLGQFKDPAGVDTSIYRVTFGPDGKLYGGTQSKGPPTIFQLDPDTLQYRVLGQVGKERFGQSFAYYIAVDPPWVYVAVGQKPWELVALHSETGEQRVLAKRDDAAFMKMAAQPEGLTAILFTGLHRQDERRDTMWIADGKVAPYDPSRRARLPFRSRSITPKRKPVENAPEVDVSAASPDARGIGSVSWRPAGSSGPWRTVEYRVKHTSPIELESLVALPDGTLYGNAKQYHGSFRHDPRRRATTIYRGPQLSRGPRALSQGILYLAGYPNGVLYAYDPTKRWTARGRADQDVGRATNPLHLGSFVQSGAKYATALVPARDGRLYFAGRRERDGFGGAVGLYDPSTRRFGGHSNRLSFLDPQGLVVLDGIDRIVYSGRLRDDPSQPDARPREAQLVVYDRELREQDRLTVKPGLETTGGLLPTDQDGVLLGIISTERKGHGRGRRRARPVRMEAPDDDGADDGADDEEEGAVTYEVLTGPRRGRRRRTGGGEAIYRYDVQRRTLLQWKDLDGQVTGVARRPADGSVWVIVDDVLHRVDPNTLAMTPIGAFVDLPDGSAHLAWSGDQLYMTSGAELRRAILPRGVP